MPFMDIAGKERQRGEPLGDAASVGMAGPWQPKQGGIMTRFTKIATAGLAVLAVGTTLGMSSTVSASARRPAVKAAKAGDDTTTTTFDYENGPPTQSFVVPNGDTKISITADGGHGGYGTGNTIGGVGPPISSVGESWSV
jgi:hypothetical protein